MNSKNSLFNYCSDSFIVFCLTTYLLLFSLAPTIHMNVDSLIFDNQIDIRLLVMLLLAEPHFAMTIPLLYGYKNNFLNMPYRYVVIPIVIIILGTTIFYKINSLFITIFLFANIYHVNRQSVGFFLLQNKIKPKIKSIYEITLHIFTFVCLYFSIILNYHSILLGLLFLFFAMLIITFFFIKNYGAFPSIRQFITLLQGYLIFFPIIIFSDLLLAFAVGISIHYIQYLIIGWRVLKVGFLFSMKLTGLMLIVYSIFSTAALSGFFTIERISIFILIPTMLQLLHFYYDSLIWSKNSNGNLVSNTLEQTLQKDGTAG